MRILLIGYGKMGKMIESLVLQAGQDEIVERIHSSNQNLLHDKLKLADAAIEFSAPLSAVHNIKRCLEEGVPVIVGTTGWYDQLEEVKSLCEEKKGAVVYASNFSIGMNLFFMLNEQLARLMQPRSDYRVQVEETHHIHKKDAPSGTAIILANDIENIRGKNKIEIQSNREGEVIGVHRVIYEGDDDAISIQHEAASRASFAKGAMAAAHWIQNRKGFFNFRDIVAQL